MSLPWRDANNERLWPSFLPDGRHLVYFARPAKPGIYLGSLDSPDTSLVASGFGGYCPWLPPLLQSGSPEGLPNGPPDRAAVRRRTAFSSPVRGPPSPIRLDYRTLWARGGFSASNNGTLVTARDTLAAEMAWFDRRGQRLETVRPLVGLRRPVAGRTSRRTTPCLRPTAVDPVVQTTDIHLFDLAARNGCPTDLRSSARFQASMVTRRQVRRLRLRARQPASQRVHHVRDRNRASAAADYVELVQHVNDWSRDGRFVLFAMLDPKTQWDIWLLPVKGDASRQDTRTIGPRAKPGQ